MAPRFTPQERRIIKTHRTPRAVQRWLRAIPYNWEREGKTLRSFRGVVRHRLAHCLEAALAAATVMEQHGDPPLLMDLESQDLLDHVVFVFRRRGRWGAIGGSRDQGLHGRLPVFRSIRDLAWSYYEPYIDRRGRILAYALADLRSLGGYDWRTSERNVWRVERFLIEHPHRPLPSSDRRYRVLRDRYVEYARSNPPTGTPHTRGRKTWM